MRPALVIILVASLSLIAASCSTGGPSTTGSSSQQTQAAYVGPPGTVEVTLDDIRLEGRPVVTLDNGEVASSDLRKGTRIVPLHRALEAVPRDTERATARPGYHLSDDCPEPQLQVDPLVPMRTLGQLVHTVTDLGCRDVEVIVGDAPPFYVGLPMGGAAAVDARVTVEGVELMIGSESLESMGSCEEPGPTICLSESIDVAQLIGSARGDAKLGDEASARATLQELVDAYDWRGFHRVLVDIDARTDRQANPTTSALTLSAQPALPAALFARAARANCRGQDAQNCSRFFETLAISTQN